MHCLGSRVYVDLGFWSSDISNRVNTQCLGFQLSTGAEHLNNTQPCTCSVVLEELPLYYALLKQKTLSDVDAATLNETRSLTWYSSQELNNGIQLLSSLQSLKFGRHFNQSLEGIQLPSSLQSLTFDHDFNRLTRAWRASNYPAVCNI